MASRRSARYAPVDRDSDSEDGVDYYDVRTPDESPPDGHSRGRGRSRGAARHAAGRGAGDRYGGEGYEEADGEWDYGGDREPPTEEHERRAYAASAAAVGGARAARRRSQSQCRAKSGTRKGVDRAEPAPPARPAAGRPARGSAARPPPGDAEPAAAAAPARAPRAPPGLGAVGSNRTLHFSPAPSSPTAAWRGTTTVFNKRIFCAAVGRVAAAHARRAAARLWDMSPPRNNKDLEELLEATIIRITVSEGQRLLTRANECLPENTPGGIVGETAEGGGSGTARATAKTQATRRAAPSAAAD
ncbi:tegument protein VP22 [Ateline alphaherpesvirus 1]|uniref:Tegument protein VP22 n=1 Tax=Herpesvirus ateles type 1 (strain Lennette) TaxID=35243 RepID=A0A1S6JLL1_HSVA1|nr:tegument protein VP22 [Ateline alphaherpesvirus 1]AQS79167.1 tegument protein VP22 [Ateline alphaherpesvirus 1]